MTRALGALLAALAVAAPNAAAATNDPYSSRQWALGQIRAETAWATSTGAGQVIAIVDSGVDLGHPDLRAKLVPGVTFVGCPAAPC